MTIRQPDDDDDSVSETRIINVQSRRRRSGSIPENTRQHASLPNPVINPDPAPLGQPNDPSPNLQDDENEDSASGTRIINVQSQKRRPSGTQRREAIHAVAKKVTPPLNHPSLGKSGWWTWLKKLFR